jgi:hypothetical protein
VSRRLPWRTQWSLTASSSISMPDSILRLRCVQCPGALSTQASPSSPITRNRAAEQVFAFKATFESVTCKQVRVPHVPATRRRADARTNARARAHTNKHARALTQTSTRARTQELLQLVNESPVGLQEPHEKDTYNGVKVARTAYGGPCRQSHSRAVPQGRRAPTNKGPA